MARRQVVEIKCDRCQRVENQEVVQASPVAEELVVTFQGQTVKYGDLCKRCREACANYFKSMTKQLEEEKKSKEVPEPKKEIPEPKGGFLGLGGKKG